MTPVADGDGSHVLGFSYSVGRSSDFFDVSTGVRYGSRSFLPSEDRSGERFDRAAGSRGGTFRDRRGDLDFCPTVEPYSWIRDGSGA